MRGGWRTAIKHREYEEAMIHDYIRECLSGDTTHLKELVAFHSRDLENSRLVSAIIRQELLVDEVEAVAQYEELRAQLSTS